MNLSKHRREIVFLLDLFILSAVYVILFYLLPECGGTDGFKPALLFPHLILLTVCVSVPQLIFKTYNSLWRYAQSKEYLKFILCGATGYLSFIPADYFIFVRRISLLFSLAGYSISLLGMLFMRLCYRQYRNRIKNKYYEDQIMLVIIGAGAAGVKLQEEIERNPSSKYRTVCFLDDSMEKIGKRIHNTEVKGPIMDMQRLLKDTTVKEIILAIPSLTPEKEKAILKVCSLMNCRIRILPNTIELLKSEATKDLWKKVRDVETEELLGREQVSLENEEIVQFLTDKIVMVTGGGGSIGSELCRQIAKVKPERLVIVDNYENNAYDIQQELLQIYGDKLDLKVEIASVRNEDRVNQLFERHHPDIVFHAAAHKHVPLMEDCPEEAIMNNILGTYHVVQAAHRYQAKKFVLISTDKAVNPTSIMGASKRFCEMILQSMKDAGKTEYAAVRFGNVLGSNGSVIPLFQKQIAKGGPVTVTDKRIVRYFMTISEAVQLVLQAGAMAGNAEIYVLDMGEPVKIIDLAENLIRLSGHVPYTEIPIIETGLRPGEKLYEELLTDGRELMATANHKIYIERQKNISQQEIKKDIDILKSSVETKSPAEIKKALKKVVPTYRDPEEVNRMED